MKIINDHWQMTIGKRRALRIRDELRQWLRSRYGMRPNYTKGQIDDGREELGFDSVEDALVAYTLFGPDLVPAFVDSIELSIQVGEISDIIAAIADDTIALTDLLADS